MMDKERENKMKQSNLFKFFPSCKKEQQSQKEDDSKKTNQFLPQIKVQEKRTEDAQANFELYKRQEKPFSRLRQQMETQDDEDHQRIAIARKSQADKYAKMKQDKKSDAKKSRKSAVNGSKQKILSNANSSVDEQDLEAIPIVKSKKKQTQAQQDDFTDKTPFWALSENCRDKQGRRPEHPDYDPSTLYIPPQGLQSLTPTMKQFWQIKAENFDKIVLFKLGKFYQLFYEDARISNKYLNLNWMGTKMHTGFPQKTLDRYVDQLVNFGFKVVVVDQMQTPDQMAERLKVSKAQGKRVDKAILREATQVLTKGTYNKVFVEQDKKSEGTQIINYTPNYLIAVQINEPLYAFVLLDVANNKIIIGRCQTFDDFKTMLYRTRPVQLLFDPSNLPYDDKRMMTQSFLGMVQSPLKNGIDIWNPKCSAKLLKDNPEVNTKVLQSAMENYPENIRNMIYSCLSGLFSYLQKLMLYESVISTSKFEVYDHNTSFSKTMILDSQALQHLQLLETSATLDEKGSLIHLINKCSTPFGKRMMRNWMCAPSTNIKVIDERLNAVEDLMKIPIERGKIADQMKNLGDLQKLINRLYQYSVKSLANKAKFSADISTHKMQQFKKLFTQIQKSWQILLSLKKSINDFKSQRLKSLLTTREKMQIDQSIYFQQENQAYDEKGLLPNVMVYLRQMDSYLKWQDDKPVPKKGFVEENDQIIDTIQQIKERLNKYLEKLKVVFKQKNLQFAHTKERYQIQVPIRADQKKLEGMIFSSRKKDINRYVTKQSRKLVQQLQKAEQKQKQILKHFVVFFFEQFRKRAIIWETYIRILGQVDCLISNSYVSRMWKSVRPQFTSDPKAGIKIKQGIHPCLSHLTFVPNDLSLDHHQSMLLLTGPNMGGKSTLLRMTCTLAIMAQMGMYVPCDYYEAILFDRIFTRIGASDRLLENKSTFYIQLEETKSILDYATERSLVIIDELGRGTSTFDGMAIADATFSHLLNKTKCIGLFATHYNIVVQQFLYNPSVKLGHMSYFVDNKTQRINFLYRLKDGRCEQSFGVNVAKMVGIDKQVVSTAQTIAKIVKQQIRAKRDQQVDQQISFIMSELHL